MLQSPIIALIVFMSSFEIVVGDQVEVEELRSIGWVPGVLLDCREQPLKHPIHIFDITLKDRTDTLPKLEALDFIGTVVKLHEKVLSPYEMSQMGVVRGWDNDGIVDLRDGAVFPRNDPDFAQVTICIDISDVSNRHEEAKFLSRTMGQGHEYVGHLGGMIWVTAVFQD